MQHHLKAAMRTFGRTCRGQGKVYLQLVRATEKNLLSLGARVEALALAVQDHVLRDGAFEPAQVERWKHSLDQALRAHRAIERQSRQLVQGKKLDHGKIVNAYDLTITAIQKGKSNCPAQFGKKPGLIAEMATGFFLGFHVPPGNPKDASYVMPLVGAVEAAIQSIDPSPLRRKPLIRSVAGDLGLDDLPLRTALHQKGIATVGIPHTVRPLPKQPTADMIEAARRTPGLAATQNATQLGIAYACGYSRPFVESLITTLASRGATSLKYKGHHGATLQIGMAMMAANAGTVVRIKQHRLTQRAQKFRRLFRLKPPNFNKNNITNV